VTEGNTQHVPKAATAICLSSYRVGRREGGGEGGRGKEVRGGGEEKERKTGRETERESEKREETDTD